MDANAEHEREALGAGLIDAVGDMKQVCGAEIIIVATPVDVSAGIIKQALDMSGENAAVIDVGSTKNRVMQNAGEHPEHRRFIPTHPMAGTENSGRWPLSKGFSVTARSYCCHTRTAIRTKRRS